MKVYFSRGYFSRVLGPTFCWGGVNRDQIYLHISSFCTFPWNQMTQNYEVNLCIIWWLVPVASREALDEGVRLREKNQTSRCVSPVSPPVQSSWIQSIGGAKAFVDALVCSAVPLILIDDSGASHPFTNTWTLDFRGFRSFCYWHIWSLVAHNADVGVLPISGDEDENYFLRDDCSANH